jgi:hypothetical protein
VLQKENGHVGAQEEVMKHFPLKVVESWVKVEKSQAVEALEEIEKV